MRISEIGEGLGQDADAALRELLAPPAASKAPAALTAKADAAFAEMSKSTAPATPKPVVQAMKKITGTGIAAKIPVKPQMQVISNTAPSAIVAAPAGPAGPAAAAAITAAQLPTAAAAAAVPFYKKPIYWAAVGGVVLVAAWWFLGRRKASMSAPAAPAMIAGDYGLDGLGEMPKRRKTTRRKPRRSAPKAGKRRSGKRKSSKK